MLRRLISQPSALFREVNVHIAHHEERVQARGRAAAPLVCEWSRTGYAFPIEVDPATFQAVRQNPLRFLVAEVELVVERHEGYLIVEKQTA